MTCGPCFSGYSDVHGNGTLCTDIDECATNHGGCDPLVTCTNIAGARTCGSCPMYYRGDGETYCVHLWSQQLGTAADDFARGAATDTSGNVYAAGNTQGGLDGNTNVGGSDVFVVKYDGTGQKQWTRQLGTIEFDSTRGVATDASGNVYVTGYTAGGLDGNINAGHGDAFIVKYDGTGQKQWTRQLGTVATDVAYGVATDTSGDVYVVGSTQDALDGNTSAGFEDLFVVKYDGTGQKQWTRQLGTSADDVANGVATDTSGNVYVVGSTKGGLDGNANMGSDDLLIAKYDGAGQKQWTRQLGTSASDVPNSVTTDTSGNLYVTGSTAGGLDGNANAGLEDLFLVKFDGAGLQQWTRQLGTSASDQAVRATADTSGNVYVAGATQGGLDGNTNAGGFDLFVIKYDGTGQKQWTRQLGTSADDEALGITTDTSGNVYVTGGTQGAFDGNTNAGGFDLFVIKYDGDGNRL